MIDFPNPVYHYCTPLGLEAYDQVPFSYPRAPTWSHVVSVVQVIRNIQEARYACPGPTKFGQGWVLYYM